MRLQRMRLQQMRLQQMRLQQMRLQHPSSWRLRLQLLHCCRYTEWVHRDPQVLGFFQKLASSIDEAVNVKEETIMTSSRKMVDEHSQGPGTSASSMTIEADLKDTAKMDFEKTGFQKGWTRVSPSAAMSTGRVRAEM